MHRRIVFALALFAALALPAHGYAPGVVPGQAITLIVPHSGCQATQSQPPGVLSPLNGTVISNAISSTVLMTVSAPSDSTRVNVLVQYEFGPPGGLTPQQFNHTLTPVPLGSNYLWTYSWPVSSLPSQGNISLSFTGYNASGSSFLIGTVQCLAIDRAPPSSTASVGSPTYSAPGGPVYVAGGTQITLSASDPPLDDGSAGSGATVYYQIDGEPAQPYTAPFTLGYQRGDGAHTITYWSVDGAGNAETPHALALALDNTPPAITPLVSGAFNADGSAYTPVTIALTASDAGSGLKGIYYDVGPGPACPPAYPHANVCGQAYAPGQQITIAATGVLNYAAVDNVGNTAEYSLPVTITTPTATPQPLATLPPPATPTPTGIATPTAPLTVPTPTATRTPRPTPTWAPIDAPPLLKRTPLRLPTPAGNPPAPTPLHVHTLPPSAPHRRTVSTRQRHAASKPHRHTMHSGATLTL